MKALNINPNCTSFRIIKYWQYTTCFVLIFFYTAFSVRLFCQEHKAYSLIVGLKEIDASAYAGKQKIYNSAATAGVDIDISEMKRIAESNGHIITSLFNREATRNRILDTIIDIGKKVKKGDSFIFYFSGHGDFVKDINGDEVSGFDQVMVAYNDFIVDDEIYALLKRYFKQTDNIMIVDACHSSTSWKYKSAHIDFMMGTSKVSEQGNKLNGLSRYLPETCKLDTLKLSKEPFDLIYFGATGDESLAAGDLNGGLLTSCLCRIIASARYNNIWNQYSYRRLAKELCEMMSMEYSNQGFQYHEIGVTGANYKNNIPFKIY